MSVKRAMAWVVFWMVLAAGFGMGIYYKIFSNLFLPMGIQLGPEQALKFFGGYIIELSLSVDNLFVFLLIFSSFGISSRYQRRVLNFGIAGAVVLRLIFIVLGVAVVERFHWVLYIFGLILIYSAAKMFGGDEDEKDFQNSRTLKVLRKLIPITDNLEGEKFFVRRGKNVWATPLLAILVIVEVSDLIFAIDSIPAIFSITTTWWIVYSSNIFAILGLRNMYFLLEKLHRSFRFMKYGVALILAFTGIKLTILFFNIEIPLVTSLIIIIGTLMVSILASVIIKEKQPETEES